MNPPRFLVMGDSNRRKLIELLESQVTHWKVIEMRALGARRKLEDDLKLLRDGKSLPMPDFDLSAKAEWRKEVAP